MKQIDLRSDTVTQPTEEMRRAMAEAVVGDDVYGDDPTVNKLERRAAEIMGKEAALFVVSGTMGNQTAIMTHTRRGDEIIAGMRSHIVHYEAGAPAVLSGVSYRLIDNPDATIHAEDVVRGVRQKDIHNPDTGLICVENALTDGRVVPLEILRDTYRAAAERGIPVHLDGARIFNAAVHLGIEAKEIAACADSVMFCLSKGLCAPVGSMLAGTEEFIHRARKNRKILGGGLRQAGVLAAPGLIALESMRERLHEDHENARYLAQKLGELEFVSSDPNEVQINMVFFNIDKPGFDPEAYVEFMAKHNIVVYGEVDPGRYRYVTHNGIDRNAIDFVVERLAELLHTS